MVEHGAQRDGFALQDVLAGLDVDRRLPVSSGIDEAPFTIDMPAPIMRFTADPTPGAKRGEILWRDTTR